MLTLQNIPLTVLNRALSLYNKPAEDNTHDAWRALRSAESRIDLETDFPGISPFAQAVAEYFSSGGGFTARAA
jgi:hypothetical protein